MLPLLALWAFIAHSYADSPTSSAPPVTVSNHAARMMDTTQPEPQPLGFGINLNVFNNAADKVQIVGAHNTEKQRGGGKPHQASKQHTTAINSDDADSGDAYIDDGTGGGGGGDGPVVCVPPEPEDRTVITNVNVNNIAAGEIHGYHSKSRLARDCEIDDFSTITEIIQRGQLICGVSTGNQVLGQLDEQGVRRGIDVDVCRAVTAAIFEDFGSQEQRRIKYLPSAAATRFGLLNNGADIVSAGTTKTVSRMVSMPITFGPVVFYDGAAILVHKDSTITDPEEIKEMGASFSICVIRSTTGPGVVDRNFQNANVFLSGSFNEMLTDWEEGRCSGAVTDFTSFLGRFDFIDRIGGRIVQDISLSKEPLAPFISDKDPAFARVIDVVLNGLVLAMERGVTSTNALNNPSFVLYEDEDKIAEELSIPSGFMRRALSAVGNYDELYDRYLGRFFSSGVIENRGLNNRNTRCGLLYGFE